MKRCSSCEFKDIAQSVEQGVGVSICRADPPKTFLVPVQTLQGNALQATTIWPSINPEVDFCSRHSPVIATHIN